MAKLSVKGLAIAFGFTWALGVLLMGWASIFGLRIGFVDFLSKVYIGYSSTFLGSIIGAIWAFVDAGIGGVIVALVYNAVAGKK